MKPLDAPPATVVDSQVVVKTSRSDRHFPVIFTLNFVLRIGRKIPLSHIFAHRAPLYTFLNLLIFHSPNIHVLIWKVVLDAAHFLATMHSLV